MSDINYDERQRIHKKCFNKRKNKYRYRRINTLNQKWTWFTMYFGPHHLEHCINHNFIIQHFKFELYPYKFHRIRMLMWSIYNLSKLMRKTLWNKKVRNILLFVFAAIGAIMAILWIWDWWISNYTITAGLNSNIIQYPS